MRVFKDSLTLLLKECKKQGKKDYSQCIDIGHVADMFEFNATMHRLFRFVLIFGLFLPFFKPKTFSSIYFFSQKFMIPAVFGDISDKRHRIGACLLKLKY